SSTSWRCCWCHCSRKSCSPTYPSRCRSGFSLTLKSSASNRPFLQERVDLLQIRPIERPRSDLQLQDVQDVVVAATRICGLRVEQLATRLQYVDRGASADFESRFSCLQRRAAGFQCLLGCLYARHLAQHAEICIARGTLS